MGANLTRHSAMEHRPTGTMGYRSPAPSLGPPYNPRRAARRHAPLVVVATVLSLLVSVIAGADLIAYTVGGTELWVMNDDGTDQRMLLGAPPLGTYSFIALSHDGEQLLYSFGSTGWDNELWAVRLDGTGNSLVAPAAWLNCLAWLEDDSEAVFQRAGANSGSLFRTHLATGVESLWVDVSQMSGYSLNTFRHSFRWSADRGRAAFGVGVAGGGSNTVFSADFDFATGTLSNVVQLSPSGSSWSVVTSGADISADGSTVFYSWRNNNVNVARLVRVASDGSGETVLLERPSAGGDYGAVRLSTDGTRLYFSAPSVISPGSWALARINVDGSGYTELVSESVGISFDVGPDPPGVLPAEVQALLDGSTFAARVEFTSSSWDVAAILADPAYADGQIFDDHLVISLSRELDQFQVPPDCCNDYQQIPDGIGLQYVFGPEGAIWVTTNAPLPDAFMVLHGFDNTASQAPYNGLPSGAWYQPTSQERQQLWDAGVTYSIDLRLKFLTLPQVAMWLYNDLRSKALVSNPLSTVEVITASEVDLLNNTGGRVVIGYAKNEARCLDNDVNTELLHETWWPKGNTSHCGSASWGFDLQFTQEPGSEWFAFVQAAGDNGTTQVVQWDLGGGMEVAAQHSNYGSDRLYTTTNTPLPSSVAMSHTSVWSGNVDIVVLIAQAEALAFSNVWESPQTGPLPEPIAFYLRPGWQTTMGSELVVTTSGAGEGTVTSVPAGIDCGVACVHTFDLGDTVTLTATEHAGSVFAGWSGDCAGTAPSCQVVMDGSRAVTALFDTATHSLTVSTEGAGTGTVTSVPPGIDCGADCFGTFPEGDTVTLTAEADPGVTFAGWSGDCSGTNPVCVVTMNADRAVTARFTLVPLDVARSGRGSGTVASTPAGIDCGTDCHAEYPQDSWVFLTADAAPNSWFVEWQGDCTGSATMCGIQMTSAKSVIAVFDSPPCTDDAFEEDDTCATARAALVGGTRTHSHCDWDWVRFDAQEGVTYELATLNLIGGADTLIQLFDPDCRFLVKDDDGGNNGAGPSSLLSWTALEDGPHYAQVRKLFDDYSSGEGYDLTVADSGVVPLGGVPLSPSATAVSLASDSSGEGVVVYLTGLEARKVLARTGGIYGIRFDSHGNPVGSSFVVSPEGTPEDHPQVSMTSGGNFVVAWWRGEGSPSGMVARLFHQDGTPSSGLIAVSDSSPTQVEAPPALDVAANGAFAIVWKRSESTTESVLARAFDADGNPLGSAFTVDTASSGLLTNPSVALQPSGRLVVAWTRGNSVNARLFDPTGVPVTAPQAVAMCSGACRPAAVETDGLGSPVVSWSEGDGTGKGRDGNGIFGRLFTPSLQPNGTPFPVTTVPEGLEFGVALGVDPGGAFVVVWESLRATGATARGRFYTAEGQPVGGEFEIAAEDGSEIPTAPRVALTREGGAFRLKVAYNRLEGDVVRGAHLRSMLAAAAVFADDFEAGDTGFWSTTLP